MTKRNLISIFLSAFLIFIILAVIVASSLNSTNNQSAENTETTNMPDNNGTNTENDDTNTDIEVDLDTDDSDDENTTIPGTYTQYSKDKLTNETNIIFFAAGWCPSCAELDSNLSSATSIPDGYTILKTDYDNSQEIREKYGVTIQHTLVQVDKDGNLIKKVNGLYSVFTLEDIIQEFN